MRKRGSPPKQPSSDLPPWQQLSSELPPQQQLSADAPVFQISQQYLLAHTLQMSQQQMLQQSTWEAQGPGLPQILQGSLQQPYVLQNDSYQQWQGDFSYQLQSQQVQDRQEQVALNSIQQQNLPYSSLLEGYQYPSSNRLQYDPRMLDLNQQRNVPQQPLQVSQSLSQQSTSTRMLDLNQQSIPETSQWNPMEQYEIQRDFSYQLQSQQVQDRQEQVALNSIQQQNLPYSSLLEGYQYPSSNRLQYDPRMLDLNQQRSAPQQPLQESQSLSQQSTSTRMLESHQLLAQEASSQWRFMEQQYEVSQRSRLQQSTWSLQHLVSQNPAQQLSSTGILDLNQQLIQATRARPQKTTWSPPQRRSPPQQQLRISQSPPQQWSPPQRTSPPQQQLQISQSPPQQWSLPQRRSPPQQQPRISQSPPQQRSRAQRRSPPQQQLQISQSLSQQWSPPQRRSPPQQQLRISQSPPQQCSPPQRRSPPQQQLRISQSPPQQWSPLQRTSPPQQQLQISQSPPQQWSLPQRRSPPQQQPRISQSPPQQRSRAQRRSPPQQQLQISQSLSQQWSPPQRRSPPQQQLRISQSPPQQWSPPQQTSPPQQQLQISQSPPQQWSLPQRRSPPQQQQRVSRNSFQQSQVTWGQRSQLRVPYNLPEQHQVSANLSSQQSILWQQNLLQQQQQKALTQPRQQMQVPRGPPQQQQQWNFFQQQQGMMDQRPRRRSQQQRMYLQHQQEISSQSRQYVAEIDDSNCKQMQTVERGTENNDMRQEQQLTTNILPMLSRLTLEQTSEETDEIKKQIKQYQARIPRRQNVKQEHAETLLKYIEVQTNMFKIIFNEAVTTAIHYDVDITFQARPDSRKFSKALYRKVFEKCRSEYFNDRYPAFDGMKNAYSAGYLPFGKNFTSIIKIQKHNKQCNKQCDEQCDKHVMTFNITLKEAKIIDLRWIKNLQPGLNEDDAIQTSIQALDIIIRHEPESQYMNVGGSLFWNLDDLNELKDLKCGVSSACGGFLSAILGWREMYLNVDVTHKSFLTPQTVDKLMTVNRNNLDVIDELCNNIKVIYQVPQKKSDDSPNLPKTYCLNGLGLKLNASQHKFCYDDNSQMQITITDHFAKHHKYKLKQPNLPCLLVRRNKKDIYLPAELCTIVPGNSVKKLNADQTSTMITHAAMDTSKRKKKIEDAFNKIVVNNSFIMKKEFQLAVDKKMTNVEAKILKAPELKYDKKVNVSNGKWNKSAIKFNQPMNLRTHEWTILNLDKCVIHSDCNNFIDALIEVANSFGMIIERPDTKTIKHLKKEVERTEIKNYFEKNKAFKLIIVIIPNSLSTIYNKIKQITELELGVLTQCIKVKNFIKPKQMTIQNLLLKINAKLNGINHTLHTIPKCFKNKCMIVGADVTHPSGEDASVAAVTASSDICGFQYNVVHKLLKHKEEIISDLEKIISFQLSIYQKKTSYLPERIIYYRDGVSEGEFPKVMYYEIEAIRRACAIYKTDIQVTCLIVQKRHHVRFFPLRSASSASFANSNNTYNVTAGTIVDTEITHPNHIEFYLVSHTSIKGTARPTKYRCIWNESNYTEDDLEELTYYLCHMYARCTNTVSYPAPTYYAHLAAYRGKVLIQGRNLKLENLDTAQQEFNRQMKESPMYFV